ncbi:uncharacterized protein LOC141666994 [Apium graveolens]|uniref:uncharacterized protein LOC141666994 n=1 Tax=Apium graveolens TaxID=4045 RepID=UPI003D791ADD
MEGKLNSFDSNQIEEAEANNHGWQKVTYAKKHKKQSAKKPDSGRIVSNGSAVHGGDGVFTTLEKQSEERRRRIEAQRAAIDSDDAPVRSVKQRSDVDDDDSDGEVGKGVQNGVQAEEKKPKVKKVKKPKVTIAEAAAKIDADDLAAFLADISASYESQQDIQMMRFADYFGRAFSAVSASQFPWTKLFRESAIRKIADIPVSNISESVYKTSVDWINQRSTEALGSFVLWSLDSIFADLASQQPSAKGAKKAVQQTTSKSQVAIFLVLAMVLRRKPDAFISVLMVLNENSKYKGQDKLPVIVWMVVQACQGDLAIGLYLWSHLILPIVGGKSGSNPQTRDLVLQLVERILAAPKARTILVNGAVRKGERLMPPSALDLLLRVTFPTSSARVKATERFEAIYPILKEVALAGVPGSKGMKLVSQQILTICTKAAGEGIPELSREAANIFAWCLTQHPDCYKQWDNIYMDNLEVSVAVLKKLTEEWKQLSEKQSSLEGLRETLKSFRHMNEKALAEGVESSRQSLVKNADKYSKWLLGRVSREHGCLKGFAFVVIALGVGAVFFSPSLESVDWKELTAFFNHQSI